MGIVVSAALHGGAALILLAALSLIGFAATRSLAVGRWPLAEEGRAMDFWPSFWPFDSAGRGDGWRCFFPTSSWPSFSILPRATT